jgi:hypothetical protein
MKPSPLTDDMTTKELRAALNNATTEERLHQVAAKMLARLTLLDAVQASTQRTLWWMENAMEDDAEAFIERVARMKDDPKPFHEWDPKAWRKMQNFRLSVRELVASLGTVPAQVFTPFPNIKDPKVLEQDEASTPVFTF